MLASELLQLCRLNSARSLNAFLVQAGRSLAASPAHLQLPERQTVTVIPGDGIGPELIDSVATLLSHVNAPVEFEEVPLSELSGARLQDDDSVDRAVASVKRNKIGLQGYMETAVRGTTRSVSMKLIKRLELFANVVHIKSIPGIKTRYNNIDFVVIREQTEDAFAGLEHETVAGVIENLKVITRSQSLKIAKFAFDFAVKKKYKKVTAVHKANIMKMSDGLFLDCCKEVALLYPGIQFSDMIVDNACMQMVSNPYQFQVLVVPNLYGSILSNLGAGIIGGAGLVPGYSIGRKYIIYEQGSRHSYGQGAGKNLANPTGIIISAVEMLHHMNLHNYADAIYNGIMKVIKDKKIRTADVGGRASTTDFVEALTEEIMPII